MNKNLILGFFIGIISLNVFSQEKTSRWSIQADYGLQYTFFVNYGEKIIKKGGYIEPIYDIFGANLVQKNRLGNYMGFEVNFALSPKNFVGFGLAQSNNYGKYDLSFQFQDHFIYIHDFTLKHTNYFYQLFYKGKISDKSLVTAGVYLLDPHQQEILIYPDGSIEIMERTGFNEYNLNEGGFFLGFEYFFYKSGKFELGVKSRLYYTASLGLFDLDSFETFSISPTLKYQF